LTLSLSENSLKILERRYLAKNEKRELIETPEEMFRRVARNIASAEALYGGDVERMENEFYEIMTSLKFLPNSPTLMNAGKPELQQLSACFVLPIDDSIGSIFDAVKYTALIHKSGGGTGFSFSRLRPKNDIVKTTGGIASGPISFMKVLNTSTEVIKQGGCLVPSTLVFSNEGLLRLDELVDAQTRGWQEHDLKVATDNGDKISPRGYNNGVVSVLRVSTEQEINLTGTPNHKVKVMTDEGVVWRQLNELKPGDAILVKLGQHKGQIRKLIHPEINHHNQKQIDLPSVLDESLAFLLGLLAGDGFVASGSKDYRIGFSISHNSYLIEELPEFLQKMFPGVHVQRMQKDDDASVNFIVSSRSLKEFLVLNNLSKEESHNVSVPLLIRQSPPSVVGAYLRGLFEADGTITHGYPVLTSTSHRLIQETSALLIGLGCPVSIREFPASEDRFGSDNLWGLRLQSHVALDV
jgi:ribonucleoside-diphosphate reductase alpha chain